MGYDGENRPLVGHLRGQEDLLRLRRRRQPPEEDRELRHGAGLHRADRLAAGHRLSRAGRGAELPQDHHRGDDRLPDPGPAHRPQGRLRQRAEDRRAAPRRPRLGARGHRRRRAAQRDRPLPPVRAKQAETIVSASAVREAKGYIGERYDADAGLLYLNARYYDPQAGDVPAAGLVGGDAGGGRDEPVCLQLQRSGEWEGSERASDNLGK